MNILIVDDDIVDRKVVKKALTSSTSEYHHIEEVGSVAEGLNAIEDKRFDVVLLDYKMPEVDGIEMVIEMRAKPHLGDTAIVMISTSEESDLALECIEAGAQDFLPKHEITRSKLEKSILHAKKRFEIEQRMHESYVAVKKMAEKDTLTGLSNRYHFEETLKVMIATNKRTEHSVALLALDLDNFKHINDTMGHEAGDIVLKESVAKINQCLRSNEGFARLGGDEFAVIIGSIGSINEVNAIAKRILDTFLTPIKVNNIEISCSVSIGAALCPSDAEDAQELLKCADIAMYRSKQGGKNSLSFYEPYYQTEFSRRFEIQNTINMLLKDKAFRLFYQPIFCSNSREILGFEALIRWPESGTSNSYTPDEFIPIAEESKLINPLGRWIISTALRQLSFWRVTTDKQLTMSINISPVQLQDPGFMDVLKKSVHEHSLSAESIILEITETALITDNEKIAQTLGELSAFGFKIALDDFGMGFSSIAHLIDYPIDIVKLDKSMQSSVGDAAKRHSIFEALSLMLRKLNFTIVAEGIETEQQLALCTELGVERLQGYLLGKPLPEHEAEKLMMKPGV